MSAAPWADRNGSSCVSVVIPTFNRAAELERVLAVLATHPGKPLTVIVVDNSSTDDTPGLMARLQPQWNDRLRYLRKAPEGPASARNAGLALVQTEFVLFHDSDVELVDDWVERALAHLGEQPEVAAVGGFIVYGFDPQRANAYGGDLSWFGLAWDVDEGQLVDPRRPAEDRIWINCSAMLARSEVVRRIGGFDETFFYGYEDSDLGWRLRLAGYRVRVFPDLVARHHVQASPGAAHPQIVFHYCKNRLRSLLRNASSRRFALVVGGYLVYTLVDLVLRAPRRAKARAILWNLARLRETFTLRRATQRGREVSDAEVFRHSSGRWFPPSRLSGQRRRPVAVAGSAPVGEPKPQALRDDRL